MGGSVSPFEWIVPIVGAHHLAYNMLAQQVAPSIKVVTPGSQEAKGRSARQALGDQQVERDAAQREQASRDEQDRIALLPANVRARASQADATLQARGARQSASQYLGA